MSLSLRLTVCLCPLLLAACVSAPGTAPAPDAAVRVTPAQMLAAIDAAAGDGEGELAVQPLRDGRVDDLRRQAERQLAAGDVTAAAVALDQALEIVPDDPALLQERAETALLLEDFDHARALATRADTLGAQVGPLCRRHRALLEQLALRVGDAGAAEDARVAMEACRVQGPIRY